MQLTIRSTMVAAAAAFARVPRAAVYAQTANAMEITVGGGPRAGTYKAPAKILICMRLKTPNQVVVTFRDLDAHDPRALSEGAIAVDNPDRPGTRTGEVRITFGQPDNAPTLYDVYIPADSKGPLLLTPVAKGGTLAFEGRTKDGIPLRVTAKCGEFTAMQ